MPLRTSVTPALLGPGAARPPSHRPTATPTSTPARPTSPAAARTRVHAKGSACVSRLSCYPRRSPWPCPGHRPSPSPPRPTPAPTDTVDLDVSSSAPTPTTRPAASPPSASGRRSTAPRPASSPSPAARAAATPSASRRARRWASSASARSAPRSATPGWRTSTTSTASTSGTPRRRPLSEQIWGHDDTLAQIVRVIRQTRPEIIMTMNPSPTPGNHGNHQQAARFAAEAFHAAADPKAFPEQLTKEGLSRSGRRSSCVPAAPAARRPGRSAPPASCPTVPTDQVFGVWEGARSAERQDLGRDRGRRPPGVRHPGLGRHRRRPHRPREDPLRLLHPGRQPRPVRPGGHLPRGDPARARCCRRPPAALPQGTELHLTADRFDLAPGQSVEVTAHVRAPGNRALTAPRVALRLPQGWTATGSGALRGAVPAGKERTATFTVTVPAGRRHQRPAPRRRVPDHRPGHRPHRPRGPGGRRRTRHPGAAARGGAVPRAGPATAATRSWTP